MNLGGSIRATTPTQNGPVARCDLPNGTGKTVRRGRVFAARRKADEATAAGADIRRCRDP